MFNADKKTGSDAIIYTLAADNEHDLLQPVRSTGSNTTGRVVTLEHTNQSAEEEIESDGEYNGEKLPPDFIINSLSGIFYLLDTDGRLVKWNKNFEKVLGYTASEISAMHALDFFDIDEKAIIAQKISAVFTKGKAEVEARLLTKSKTKVLYKFEATTAEFEGKLSLMGIAVCVPDKKESSEAPIEMLAALNFFFENSTDPLIIAGDNGQVSDCNAAAKELIDHLEIEIDECTLSSLIDLSGEQANVFFEELHEKGQFQGELTLLSRDSRRIKCQLAAQHFMSEKGKGIAVIVRQLRPGNSVGDGNEVQNDRELLIKELMKTNADLKQFSFTTSHNLRAPVSNITGILDLIDYSSLDPVNRQMFEMLKESGRQLIATLEDLSNILVIKNNLHPEVHGLDISTLFNAVYQIFANELETVKGRIITDFKIREVNFQKAYLESIFINLISNAIKYRSPDRSLVLHISTGIDTQGNCILTFSDNGVGIDLKKHKNKVFGLYQRFNTEIEGHGLGLFIIKTQINALGGNIEVESEVGRGTTFIITFAQG